ncbi:hypothetical protein Pelo_4908 [Pelomyxa schiedti]|nr:hypothetical protein Pelo_4908 [Pelomyxa schiedti]
MKLSVDSIWRQSTGITHTELANHVICGSWVKWGLNAKAICRKCTGKSSEPVEITLRSLPVTNSPGVPCPPSTEVIIFSITPMCSSTRSHIGSKIVLLVSTIPGIGAISSNCIALCSKPPRGDQGSTAIRLKEVHPLPLLRRHLPVHFGPLPTLGDTSTLVHTKGTVEFVSFTTTSNRQYIVDSRSVTKLPESTIAGITERISRRPAVFISIISIEPENFCAIVKALKELTVTYDFSVQYRQISRNLFVLATIHKNVENFCYSNDVRYAFIHGNNPFHIDLSKPNPILKYLGWANNTFSQKLF